MAPISQLAVLGLASAVLAVPHAHNHMRDAHPGAPPAYGDSPPAYGASSSAGAVSSSAPPAYGSSSSAAAVSSSAPAGYGSSSSAAAVSSSAPAYGSGSAPAGYGSSSSAAAVSSSGVPSYSYSFSGSVSSGYAGPTGGYAHPTGSYGVSTGGVYPTGSYSGPASYSTCTETSTLIYRSSTEYSTYYVTHTIYPGGSSAGAGSSSATAPGGYPSGGAGGYPSGSAPVSPASSGAPGGYPGSGGEGTCVPDVTVTTTEKSTIYVTVGPSDSAPSASGGYPGSWEPAPSTSAAPTPSSAPAPSGGYPGSLEPAPSASAPAAPSSYAPAPSSAPAAPSSYAPAPSSPAASPSSYAPAPSSSAAPPSYGGASGYGGKRGVNYNDASLTNMFSSSSHVGWAMNWESDSKGLDSGIPYIPTLWGSDSMWTSIWDTNAETAISNGAKWFFGPNEPDMPSQANLSPDAAADLWRQYMEPYAGRVKLVAPAVTSGIGAGLGADWLKSFMSACSDCTIDAVGQHWYNSNGNDVQSFKDTVNAAIEAGNGKPVWVNEFGAIGSDEEKSAFLEEVMSWMDSNDSVLGYGYFMVSDGLLCSGDAPSAYGETYMNYSG